MQAPASPVRSVFPLEPIKERVADKAGDEGTKLGSFRSNELRPTRHLQSQQQRLRLSADFGLRRPLLANEVQAQFDAVWDVEV